MIHNTPLGRGVLAAAMLLVLAAGVLPAGAANLPARTLRLSITPAGTSTDGNSAEVAVSGDGRVVAMSTTATDFVPGDPNGAVPDVATLGVVTGTRLLVSEGGDGPSYAPVLTHDGGAAAFVSEATNLVGDDTNGVADVFVRSGAGPIVRVSVPDGGGQADAPSYQPDITADGAVVVFTSAATNLVPGDTNGTPDVFARNLETGRTFRLSVDVRGGQANGRSSQPAISGDGEIVAFESGASNLVEGDTNGIADVFVRDLQVNSLDRVSVSSTGRQQNKSVIPPFTVTPDVSRDGRYVVFESDATNLVATDRNGKTDIFLRDRTRKTTALVSTDSENTQGNNDSFAPRITPNGRFIAFESFASNLTPGQDGPREDIFVRDLRRGGTAVVTVASDGSPRGPEQVSQLLQRPSLSADARVVAFGSTALNLVPDDGNAAQDAFIRLTDPPHARLVSRDGRIIRVDADDPRADAHLCRIDARDPFRCGDRIRLPRLAKGKHVLEVRAGGAGMLFDTEPLRVDVTADTRGPRVRITQPRGRSVSVIRGTARDAQSRIRRVEVAVTYIAGGTRSRPRCRVLTTSGFRTRSCNSRVFVRATGTSSWRRELPSSIRGPIAVYARGYDARGNRGRTAVIRFVLL